MVLPLDIFGKLGEYLNVILAIQNRGITIALIVCILVNNRSVVRVLVLIFNQFRAYVFVDGEGLKDVFQHLSVVGTICS